MCAYGILAVNIRNAILSTVRAMEDYDEFDYDDKYDDEYEEDEEGDEPPLIYPGIPRWRQPKKSSDFSKTKPADRSPCGSRRKFKNCHGTKMTK